MSMETDRIEADLTQSRHRLNDTLSALGTKLSPGQMVDEVLGLAQGQAGQFAGNLGRQVRDNPLPAVLIGAGIALLLVNKSNHHGGSNVHPDDWHNERRYRSLEEARWRTARHPNEADADYEDRLHSAYAGALDLKQKAGEAAHEFKARVAQAVDGARDAAQSVRERLSSAASNAKSYIADKAHQASDRVGDVKHGAQNFYDDSPLSAGAIALAIGALLGGSMPLSDTERDALSGVADKAARTGADLAQRGAKMVEDGVNAPVH